MWGSSSSKLQFIVVFNMTLLGCFAPLHPVHVNMGLQIIHIITVHINFCTVRAFVGRERHSGLRAAGFCRFPLFFMNGMNNYPGTAANSEETSQTLPSYRPQPTRRKTCRNTHQIPALYSPAASLAHQVFFFLLLLCFCLCCCSVSLKLVFLHLALYLPLALPLHLFICWSGSSFLDHTNTNTRASNELRCERKWWNTTVIVIVCQQVQEASVARHILEVRLITELVFFCLNGCFSVGRCLLKCGIYFHTWINKVSSVTVCLPFQEDFCKKKKYIFFLPT